MNECPDPAGRVDGQEARACARALLALSHALELARATPTGESAGPWTERTADALAPGRAPLPLWRQCLRLCTRDLLERLPAVRSPR